MKILHHFPGVIFIRYQEKDPASGRTAQSRGHMRHMHGRKPAECSASAELCSFYKLFKLGKPLYGVANRKYNEPSSPKMVNLLTILRPAACRSM